MANDVLEVRNGTGNIFQRQRTQGAPIERVHGISSCGDRFVVALTRACELPLIKQEIGQFLVVPRRRIIENNRFELLDARTALKALEEISQKLCVGQDFRDDVCRSTEETAHENDPDPIVCRAPSRQMNERKDLENESPRKKEVT